MYQVLQNTDRHQAIKTNVKQEKKLTASLNTYLKFAIAPHTIGLIESEFIQEVITVRATDINPVPNKPSCILGILSRRRHVYWAIDLGMLLGLQPLDQYIGLYEVIIVNVQERALALVVPSISGVVNIPSDRYESDSALIPATLKPYLSGYVNESEEITCLFRADSILRSAILHS
jgi:chemotaxis signal transduction protein